MLFSDGAGVNISCGSYCPISRLLTLMVENQATNIIFNLFSYTIRFLTLFLCCRCKIPYHRNHRALDTNVGN